MHPSHTIISKMGNINGLCETLSEKNAWPPGPTWQTLRLRTIGHATFATSNDGQREIIE